jgi:peptidoglycan/LPS O-acetylase OafA/YrhL
VQSDQSQKRHIRTLDGWRSLALLSVLLCHTAAGLYEKDTYFALKIPRYGTFALDVFFGLSGLLICKLFLEEFDKYGAISLPAFYAKRFCRIFPPCATFTLVVFALGLIKTKWELASCLLFFRNMLPSSLGGHYTAHLWSLSIEEHFYLLLPAVLLFVGVRQSLGVLIAAALGCEVWRTIDLHFHLLSAQFPQISPGARTDLRLDSFLWGCVAAHLIHRGPLLAWLKKHYTEGIWWCLIGICLFSIQYPASLPETFLTILIPALLVGPALHTEWRASRFLELLPMRYLGRISYSFYIWQQIFLVPSWEPKIDHLKYVQAFPFNLLAVVVSSVAGFYLVERPLTRIGQIAAKAITSRTRAVPQRTSLLLA